MLYFIGTVFSPTPSVLTRNNLEEFGRVLVPAAESFNDERLEENPLSPAVVEVVSDLRGFPHLDGCGSDVGCAVEDSFLDGGNHTDVKGYFATIDPVLDENVGWPGERTRDETGHFLLRVKRCKLRLREDFVPNAVMTASFHSMVVAAVESMIAIFVKEMGTLGRAAIGGGHERDSEPVT